MTDQDSVDFKLSDISKVNENEETNNVSKHRRRPSTKKKIVI